MRSSLLTLALASLLTAFAALPAIAQDAQPGDSCAGFPVANTMLSGGPEIPGGHLLICDGSIWQQVIGYSSTGNRVMFGSAGTAAAPLHVWGEAIIGNEGLPCTSPAEGALRYTSSTDTWEYCDGAAWAWLGGSDGGQWSYLTTATPSAASVVDFTDLSAYDAVKFVGWLDFSTTATLAVRTDSDNGASFDSGGSDYKTYTGGTTGTNSYIPIGANTHNPWDLVNIYFEIILWNPGDSGRQTVVNYEVSRNYSGSDNIYTESGGGRRYATQAVNALRIFPTAGTATGTVHVYTLNSSGGGGSGTTMLYGGTHSVADCESINGYARGTPSGLLCVYPGTACPGGWNRLNDWGGTSPKACFTNSINCSSCFAVSHAWSDTVQETCSYGWYDGFVCNSNTCTADQKEVGCY